MTSWLSPRHVTLHARVGVGVALDLLLTGRPLLADEALRLGLVARVVPADRLQATADELAQQLGGYASGAVRAIRQAVREGVDLPLAEGLRLEGELSTLLTTTQDRVEGAAAFAERRDPVCTGQ